MYRNETEICSAGYTSYKMGPGQHISLTYLSRTHVLVQPHIGVYLRLMLKLYCPTSIVLTSQCLGALSLVSPMQIWPHPVPWSVQVKNISRSLQHMHVCTLLTNDRGAANHRHRSGIHIFVYKLKSSFIYKTVFDTVIISDLILYPAKKYRILANRTHTTDSNSLTVWAMTSV